MLSFNKLFSIDPRPPAELFDIEDLCISFIGIGDERIDWWLIFVNIFDVYNFFGFGWVYDECFYTETAIFGEFD